MPNVKKIETVAHDMIVDIDLVDASNNIDNKKLFEGIYNDTVKALETFLDRDVLSNKIILVLVDTATVYNKPNKNFRIYEKSNEVSDFFGPIGVKSLVEPYNKPLLIEHIDAINHNSDPQQTAPIGRVLYGVDKNNICYAGSYVSDYDSIEKIRDKRFWSKSVGFSLYKPRCSICGSEIDYESFQHGPLKCTANKQTGENRVQHVVGQKYEDKIAYLVCKQIFKEISYVSDPATVESKTEFFKLYKKDSAEDSYNINSMFDSVDKRVVVYEYDKNKKFYMPGFETKINNTNEGEVEAMEDDKKVNDELSKIGEILGSMETRIGAFEDKINAKQSEIDSKNAEIETLKKTISTLEDAIKNLKDENVTLYKTSLIEKIKEIAKKTPELQISDKVEEKPIEELESFLTLIECNSDFLKTSKSEPEPKKEVQQKQQSNAEKVQPQIKDNVKMPPKNENENDSFDKLNSSFVKRTQLLKSKK